MQEESAMHQRALLGKRGEEIAAAFLERRGFTIAERNYRSSVGEIDIIACKDDTITFVEVKTRRSLWCGIPSASVTYQKQKKIRRVAQHYLQWRGCFYCVCSFDVIEIFVHRDRARIRWLPHCFY